MRLAETLTLLTLTLFALTQTPSFTIATDYEHEFDDVFKKGILFNEESKILLTEKFIPVQFLVPFLSYNFTLKPELVTMLDKLNHMWGLPSSHCPLDFASHFQSNHSSFNVNWMFHKIEHEVNQSKPAETLTLLTLTLFALTQTPSFTIATDYEHEFDDVLKKEFYLMKSQKFFWQKNLFLYSFWSDFLHMISH